MKEGEGLSQDGTTFIFYPKVLKLCETPRIFFSRFNNPKIQTLFPVSGRWSLVVFKWKFVLFFRWAHATPVVLSVVSGLIVSIAWKFIGNKNSRTHLRLIESQTLSVGYRSVSMNSSGDPKCLLKLDSGFTVSLGAEKPRFVHSVVLTAQRPPGLADCPSTPICPPSSLLSFACVLLSTALDHLFQEFFFLPVGKHNRLMLTRTVFRGRQP